MALSLAEKQVVVKEVSELAKKSISAVVADYRGLTVSEMTQLRTDAREAGVTLRVVRNTLARRALEGTEFECMREVLSGPIFLAFSQDAPGAAARVLKAFAEDHDKFEVKALSLNGKLLEASQLGFIASLPTKKEALGKLAYVLKAPLTNLARTLAEPHAKLVRTIAAIGDKKKQEAA